VEREREETSAAGTRSIRKCFPSSKNEGHSTRAALESSSPPQIIPNPEKELAYGATDTESGKRIGFTPKSAKRWIRKNKQRKVMLFRIWYEMKPHLFADLVSGAGTIRPASRAGIDQRAVL
jgi:hypothetical protein